jgi:prepilin signal peptidase PulO-like enzyme (type II secretory pathway)
MGGTRTRSERAPAWRTVVLVLLACGWLLAPALLLEFALVNSSRLFGAQPNPYEQQRAVRYVEVALFTLVAFPAAATAVSAVGRRRLATRLFAIGTALALIVATIGMGCVVGLVVTPAPDAPPGVTSTHCQERSGGDTQCPGG